MSETPDHLANYPQLLNDYLSHCSPPIDQGPAAFVDYLLSEYGEFFQLFKPGINRDQLTELFYLMYDRAILLAAGTNLTDTEFDSKYNRQITELVVKMKELNQRIAHQLTT